MSPPSSAEPSDELAKCVAALHQFSLAPDQPASLRDKNARCHWAHLYRGSLGANGPPVVIKVIDVRRGGDDYETRFFIRDLSALRKLEHPCLLKIIESQAQPVHKWVIFMEYAPGGSLFDLLLEQGEPLDEDEARHFYRQFGSALQYMHHEGYSHRNVKCEKILLNHDRTHCKLADFALVRSSFPANHRQPLLLGAQSHCASVAYVAPEALRQMMGGVKQKPYNSFQADVWSAGVVLYAMLHAKLPFHEWTLYYWIEALDARRYSISEQVSEPLRQLIALHLAPDPAARPTMDQALEHKWITTQPQPLSNEQDALSSSAAAVELERAK